MYPWRSLSQKMKFSLQISTSTLVSSGQFGSFTALLATAAS